MPSPENVVAHKPKRGEKTVRDGRRDAVMRKIFAKPGFAADVARRLEVTHQNVSSWNRVPAHHVIPVAEMLNMTPEQIRPDVFGRGRR